MFCVLNRGWKATTVLAIFSAVGLASPALAGHESRERDGRVVTTSTRVVETTTRVETNTRWRDDDDRVRDARRDNCEKDEYGRGRGRRDDDCGRDRFRERDHGWDHHRPRCEPAPRCEAPPRCAPPPRCEPPRAVCPPRRIEGIGIGIRIGLPGVIIIGDARR